MLGLRTAADRSAPVSLAGLRRRRSIGVWVCRGQTVARRGPPRETTPHGEDWLLRSAPEVRDDHSELGRFDWLRHMHLKTCCERALRGVRLGVRGQTGR